MKDTLAKKILKEKGWSYRKASIELGVTYVHLCYVCNGQRESKSLVEKIKNLPDITLRGRILAAFKSDSVSDIKPPIYPFR